MLIAATIRLQICTNIIFKWLSFRNRLLCLAQQHLLIGNPGYLNNILKLRAILSQFRTSDAILFDGGTILEALSAIVPSSPLFLVHGIYYHMIYARSNHPNVLKLNRKIISTLYNTFFYIVICLS